jgi:type IV pilus assembly protein PilN
MNVINSLQATRPNNVHLFEALARNVPKGVYLTGVKQDGNDLTITGRAESNARVSAYMSNIDNSDWMADSKLDVIETKENEISRVSDFTLQAQQSSPGAKQAETAAGERES